MDYRTSFDGGEEPSNWELYRLLADLHKSVHGNGQKGLIKTVEEHATTLKIIGASILVLAPIVIGNLVTRIWPIIP